MGGFKKFLLRGNLIDLAVAVGASFKEVRFFGYVR